MVVSLNIGSVTVDFKYKPRGREGVMVAGRIKMGPHDCLIRPQDIELRTIRSIILTPMMGSAEPAGYGNSLGSDVNYRGVLLTAYMGSRGVLDTSRAPGTAVGNYVRVRAQMIGSFSTGVGTCRVGSAVSGSFHASFMAFGN